MVRESSTSQSVIRVFILWHIKSKLRDPRWQKMQSEIRERDGYKCQLCGSTTSFLHVHHLYYKPSTKVWEYDKESLVTLCEDCHLAVHTSLPKIGFEQLSTWLEWWKPEWMWNRTENLNSDSIFSKSQIYTRKIWTSRGKYYIGNQGTWIHKVSSFLYTPGKASTDWNIWSVWRPLSFESEWNR